MVSNPQLDKCILITGCSSGIGMHCAKRLCEDGWRVFATVRKDEDRSALEEVSARVLLMDYRDGESIRVVMDTVLAETSGRLDALFNNGGRGQPGAVEDLPTDVIRELFEVNFFGWHELTRLVVPVMRRAGHGRIVHCSSILGFVPMRWRGAYNASKFALEGLADTMRLELAGTNIHVSLIQPGPIKTQFSKNALQHFESKIDMVHSVHAKEYRSERARLQSGGGVSQVRRSPEAVYDKLKHALISPRPKARYRVTVPAHFMAIAKRLLPTALIDRILLGSN
jgi:NAD(P)-dependent dehydrogenase (short-subunit alcohol dehydrogenase family)